MGDVVSEAADHATRMVEQHRENPRMAVAQAVSEHDVPADDREKVLQLVEDETGAAASTDGGRSAGNPETRLGEARKQLRILLDDVEFEDEDTAEYVEGALACAESAAVCLEGEDALGGEPGAFQAWETSRDGGER